MSPATRVTQTAKQIMASKRLDFIRKIELGALLLAAIMIFMAIFMLSDGLEFNLTPIHPESWAILIFLKTFAAAVIINLVARVVIKMVATYLVGTAIMPIISWSIGIVTAFIYLASKIF
jgi:hypothetical protein